MPTRDRPAVSSEMVEAGVNVLIESGMLWDREPSRGPLKLLMGEILHAALAASVASDKNPKSLSKRR